MASNTGGVKRKQPEGGAPKPSPAPKRLVSIETLGSVAAAPVRYNIPKENKIAINTPIVAQLPPLSMLPVQPTPEVTFIPQPRAGQLFAPSYQQALGKVSKHTVQYVFPHLAPNKGQASANNDPYAKKHLRKAAGEVWEDPTLVEWNPEDHRIFVGDLGNEVNDDVLYRAFFKYPSILKAKVLRDKKSGKSRGYGFVSFGEPGDMVKALKEMNGQYIGNRPCKLKKSRWKDRAVEEEPASTSNRK